MQNEEYQKLQEVLAGAIAKQFFNTVKSIIDGECTMEFDTSVSVWDISITYHVPNNKDIEVSLIRIKHGTNGKIPLLIELIRLNRNNRGIIETIGVNNFDNLYLSCQKLLKDLNFKRINDDWFMPNLMSTHKVTDLEDIWEFMDQLRIKLIDDVDVLVTIL